MDPMAYAMPSCEEANKEGASTKPQEDAKAHLSERSRKNGQKKKEGQLNSG